MRIIMKSKLVVTLATVGVLALNLQADVLKLKKGSGIQGMLVSANSNEIVFSGVDGTSKTYSLDAVSGIDFAPLPPPPEPAPTTKAKTAARADVVTIPSGTQITVRTIDSIDGKTAKPGMRYRASIDDPVKIGSQTAIPTGANATLEVINLEQGQGMALRLRDVNVAGKSYSTSTQYADVEAQGTSKTKKAVRRGVGLGAIGAGIGAIAGGGSGAAIGAAIGGGAGAVSGAAAKGKQINLPTESRLIFTLTAPVPMN
jgi:hypothetical protein